jgi:glutamine synthetase
MIIVRHTEECASKPNPAGYLTGKCNCKTAPLDKASRKQLERLLEKLAGASSLAGEEPEYFTLRLDQLADQIAQEARVIRKRRTFKRCA